MKRKREFDHSENPPVKHENESRSETDPASLTRSISPPVISRRKSSQLTVTTAQVEAGERDVKDHLSFFSSKLHSVVRATASNVPRLEHHEWVNLYSSNINNPQGRHFVIHQHDHPASGTHYDLRLQCNGTSSVSWAIMYGLPGDPNSRRLNRNATETRIHRLWNHLIETASHQTGTLLIWDTGYYEVLPYHRKSNRSAGRTTDEDDSDSNEDLTPHLNWSSKSQAEKLHISFQNRKIRLRLHGTRLPTNYTISIRLSRDNNRMEQPAAPKRRRKKSAPNSSTSQALDPSRRREPNHIESSSDSNNDTRSTSDTNAATSSSPRLGRKLPSLHRHESPPPPHVTTTASSTESNPTEPSSQEHIRQTNAYPGATNSINSIHQRKWYLSLDAASSGFIRTPRSIHSSTGQRWTHPDHRQHYPFHVLGPSHERSVVTGRLAREILEDEGVVGYVPRGKWRAVVD